MLSDDALRATFHNFSTLFLLVAIVTVPVHVVHSYVWRDVIAVSALHEDIEDFPQGRKVRGVSRGQVHRAKLSLMIITLVEVASVPLFMRAARTTARADPGDVPTVAGAWLGVARGGGRRAPFRDVIVPVLASIAFAVAVGWLARSVGLLVVEPLPDARAWLGVGLVDGASRALAGAFVAGPLAYLWWAPKDT